MSKHTDYVSTLTEAGFAGADAERILRSRMASPPQSGRIKVEATKGDEDAVDVFVYDSIGFDWFGDGITAKKLNDQLKAAGSISRINVYINSPGGDAFDGIAMHTILKRQKAKVAVSVDALAASAATLVAMAADPGELKIAESGFFMIHRSWTIAMGNTKEMQSTADLLDKLDGQIAGMYAARSGRRSDTFLKMMDEESWFTGEEAVTEKLADAVTPAKRAAAWWNPSALSSLRNAPAGAVERLAALMVPESVGPSPEIVRARLLEISQEDAA